MATQDKVAQLAHLRELGTTREMVFPIGLGGMPMSIHDRPSEAQSIATIHKALELGVTLIDTADAYCLDESDKHHNEKLIYRALQQYSGNKSQVLVATKGGLMRPDGAWTQNGNPDHLRKTIRESFEALGGDRPIDIWQYHSPDLDSFDMLECRISALNRSSKREMWLKLSQFRTSTILGIAILNMMVCWNIVNQKGLLFCLGVRWVECDVYLR
jgi:aryl-alcohol dehydrogenase-like predicted oxidoreductase